MKSFYSGIFYDLERSKDLACLDVIGYSVSSPLAPLAIAAVELKIFSWKNPFYFYPIKSLKSCPAVYPLARAPSLNGGLELRSWRRLFSTGSQAHLSCPPRVTSQVFRISDNPPQFFNRRLAFSRRNGLRFRINLGLANTLASVGGIWGQNQESKPPAITTCPTLWRDYVLACMILQIFFSSLC